ncbi:MAG: NHL repeat-containing protein [Pirellulaceae bacterium]|jgi:DNA-binding beta-propeller fold protein YncE|nr:NHL repeat-containing protein [Pirellulaceae bacterium]
MSEVVLPRIGRRKLLRDLAFGAGMLASGSLAGCVSRPAGSQQGQFDKLWGRRGSTVGHLNKPRAITIDKDDLLYIVDVTPRIQVFTGDGEFVRGWQPPEFAWGKPSGLAFDREGNLLVADTHYHRILVYTPEGQLLEKQTLGGTCGPGPGEFFFVTDSAQDSQGNYYVTEYGEFDRIQKFTPDHQFLCQWGSHGNELGQFLRPQKIVIDQQDQVWVTDACNHRVQVFEARNNEPRLITSWGEQGHAPGQLNYPYDILLDEAALAGSPAGFVYLCEFGNHRVQKFTLDGQFAGLFGTNGRREAELDQPWGITRDSRGRMYVLDSYNHRVQRFWL